MPGLLPEQIANLKVAYAFMIGYPGKKLLFMGQDFGQIGEWDESRSLDWTLMEDPHHQNLHRFYGDLLQLYRRIPALHQDDSAWDGFQWIRSDDIRRSIFSFIRRSRDGKDCLLFVLNFTPTAYPFHRIGVPCLGQYQLILDETGSVSDPRSCLAAVSVPEDGKAQSIAYPLSAYGIHVYRFDYPRH